MTESKERQSQATSVVTTADFYDLKTEVKELVHQIKNMQSTILLKLGSILGSLIVLAVGISFGAFFYINDLRMELMNEHHQARFERLEGVVLSPANEVIFNEIRKLKEDYKTLLRTNGEKQTPDASQSPQPTGKKTRR